MGSLIRRGFVALAGLLVMATAAAAQPASQSEFVPMNQLPQVEQLPAAPLLIAAYAFVWVAVLFYVWTVWRRLGKVEADMQALARRSGSAR